MNPTGKHTRAQPRRGYLLQLAGGLAGAMTRRVPRRIIGSIIVRIGIVLLLSGAITGSLYAAERIIARGLFRDRAVLEIDGQQRLLRAGQTSPEGVKLISASSRKAVVEDQGKRTTLTLGSSINTNFSAPTQQRMKIIPDVRGMYRTTGSINGLPVQFIVDTGATLVSMNSRQARRLGIDYRVVGESALSTTASGYSKIYRVKLKRVKIGEIELRNIEAAVHEGDFPPITLLGMSFLGRLDIQSSGAGLELKRKY